MKKYCIDCKHLKSPYWDEAECHAPGNTTTYDNWLHEAHARKKHPKKINKRNDCTMFEGSA